MFSEKKKFVFSEFYLNQFYNQIFMNNFYIGINCAIECNFIFHYFLLIMPGHVQGWRKELKPGGATFELSFTMLASAFWAPNIVTSIHSGPWLGRPRQDAARPMSISFPWSPHGSLKL